MKQISTRYQFSENPHQDMINLLHTYQKQAKNLGVSDAQLMLWALQEGYTKVIGEIQAIKAGERRSGKKMERYVRFWEYDEKLPDKIPYGGIVSTSGEIYFLKKGQQHHELAEKFNTSSEDVDFVIEGDIEDSRKYDYRIGGKGNPTLWVRSSKHRGYSDFTPQQRKSFEKIARKYKLEIREG